MMIVRWKHGDFFTHKENEGVATRQTIKMFLNINIFLETEGKLLSHVSNTVTWDYDTNLLSRHENTLVIDKAATVARSV